MGFLRPSVETGPAMPCFSCHSLCSKSARWIFTGLRETARNSRDESVQVIELIELLRVADSQLQTQNPPVLSTLGVQLPLPAP
jgi:hypothetical protein